MSVTEPTTAAVPTPAAAEPRSPLRFDAFSSRNFTIFWLSLIATNTGTWMASVAEGWLITDLEPEHKSLYVGILAMAFAIPMLILPPFGGILADRLPKLTGIKLTQAGFLILNGTVAVIALSGHITVHILIAAAFLGAVVLAFDSPIRHSMVPDLVPREHMTSAVSLNSVAFSGAGLVGPAIGGLLIPVIGAGGVFLINTISSLSVIIALKLMHDLPESARIRSDSRADDPRSALKRAITYIRSTPLVAALYLTALVAGFFGRSYGPMLPVLSRVIYKVGSSANGILISAGGLGAMTGGLLLSAISSRLARRGRWIIALVALQGLLIGSLALHHIYLLGVVTLLAMGAIGGSAVALITAIVQEQVAPELRGRVMGFFLLTFISFPSAGSFLLGLIGDQSSLQWALGIFASVILLLIVIISVRAPALKLAP
jgi:MFS family permease